jgi:serine/threonine-protein kinase
MASNQNTEAQLRVGQVFNEMYRIVRPIGTGGMGAVYEAAHTRLHNKRFAIKMLHASIAQDAEVFQRFRREAEIATELGHPHIVEVHDFNITPDGAPYMVMEFLEGEDLASRLQKRGPMHLEQMFRLVAEICSALEAAHGAGIVHRDLKPQNIFLCKKLQRDDFVKIVDFGISKVKDSSSVVTRDHSLMGTPFYMSPEQADGLVQQIDNRTDIFALGAILWEMLTGRMAFEAPTISGAMYKVVHVDPAEVHTMRPDVPPAVSMVLRRALAKNKLSRYPNVAELSFDFGNACRGVMPAGAVPPLVGGQRPPSNVDQFAATGYVTPVPNQPVPHQPMPHQGAPVPSLSNQPFPATAAPQPGLAPHTGLPPGSFTPQPFPPPQSYPPTGAPPGAMTPGSFAPQPFLPPQSYPPGGGPQAMAPPQQAMMGTPVPVSTMSGAAGQMMGQGGVAGMSGGAMTATPAKKGKGLLIGAIVGALGLGAAAAVVVPKLGDKSSTPGAASGTPDGGNGPRVVDKPSVTPDAQVAVAIPAPIDAGVKVVAPGPADAGAAATTPVDDDVTITFQIGFDKPAAKGVTPKLTVDGIVVPGDTITVKRGARPKVEIAAPGYKTERPALVTDADRTVQVTLKKKAAAGTPGGGLDWVP